MTILDEGNISVRTGFGGAARERYAEISDNIGQKHLVDFVKEAQASTEDLQDAIKLLLEVV